MGERNADNKEERPKIGVGVIILKGSKVLLGRRKNAHGEGQWQFPGGHLEFNETPEQTAIRETTEEAGVKVNILRRGPYTNDFFEKEGKHYVTLYMITELAEGEPKAMEPNKCEGWQWFSWNELPRPLFTPIENLLDSGFSPFD